MDEREPVTAERWRIIKEILADVRDQPSAERRQWLMGACADDAELLRDVESFLDYEEQLTGFIEEPALALIDWAPQSSASDSFAEVGRLVGPYRLVRLLGEGGMGAVFLANRQQDFEQRVALKVVRPGIISHDMIERFHAERQILAMLEHPNIARLLDGGTTAEGAPYFAMEVVDGEPIDRWCDRHELSVRRRLELFIDICAALQLAHQNLIVHRDLKPSNILVDTNGIPKLLDFGIAKQLSGDDSSTTNGTQLGAMTPRYCSPEQLQQGIVGTSSDVYSLAVVMYQVLTGHLPQGLESRNPMDLLVAVCEQDPLPASVAVAHQPEAPEVMDRTEPSPVTRPRPDHVRRQLAGDIDAILAKALRKEPRLRYSSMEQLAADLRRHLDGLPVMARQGTVVYRANRFLRRHRLMLAAAALVLLLVVGFTAALVRQLHLSEQSRHRAEDISTFLVELFQSAAPDRPATGEATVRDLLDHGRDKLEGELGISPEVRATLLLKLGEVYLKLGDYDLASELLEESIALLRHIHGGDHPDLAAAMADLAAVSYKTGDLEMAETRFRASLAMRRRLGHEDDLIKPSNNLATVLMARGEVRQAETVYRENLQRRRAAVAASPASTVARGNLATNLRSLAMALLASGELEKAEPLLLESLELRRQIYGEASPKVASVLLAMGRLDRQRGRLEEAEARVAAALEIRRSELGEDHADTALAQKDLAALLLGRGEVERAHRLLSQALRTLRRIRPPGDDDIVEAEAMLQALE